MNAELTEDQKEMNIGKDFLEIPLNIKYKFGLPLVGNIVKPYLLTVSPAVAIKLNKSSKSENSEPTKTAQAVGTSVLAWSLSTIFKSRAATASA